MKENEKEEIKKKKKYSSPLPYRYPLKSSHHPLPIPKVPRRPGYPNTHTIWPSYKPRRQSGPVPTVQFSSESEKKNIPVHGKIQNPKFDQYMWAGVVGI